MKYLSLAAMLIASPALADGFTATSSTPLTSRPVSCYAKLIGSGEFITDRITMPAVTVDAMGQAVLGVGGQLGCDITSNQWVAGLFIDGVWNEASVNVNVGALNVMHIPFKSEYSIGGRVGMYTTQSRNTLLYGLVAYEVASQSATMLGVPLGLSSPKGVAIGGGIETALNQYLTLSLEYRHVGFDTNSSSIIPMQVTTTDNNVRVGLGVKF